MDTGISGSLTVNWLNQIKKPDEQQLNIFLTGNGVNGGLGFIYGAGESWSPGNGMATGIGLYWPQIRASYNYIPSSFTKQTDIKW